MADLAVFYAVGVALVVVGVAVIILVLIRASTGGGSKSGRVEGAGVIMIGPIPIVFGTDKRSVKAVLVLALALSIVMLIFYLFYYGVLR